ncbi:MAG: c-type cytochrome biogenesis protein CcsB [Thermodesulfobacteriota bacterium]|nr:c-type cytochrome biogenesis protein CcsB [Thermodesulfobacteriota bacterium]
MTVNNFSNLLFIISTTIYLAGMTGYILYLFIQKERMENSAFTLMCAGFIVHLFTLILDTVNFGTLPVYNLHQNLSIAAFALAGVFILLKYRFNLKILGIFTAPLIALTMIAALAAPQSLPLKESILKGFWLISHVILIFSGEAALAIACCTGILYLLQERAIKNKTRGFFYKRLPSLDLLDSTSYSCIVTGFTMLTFGLITGLVYAKSVWGQFWSWDPKEVWSVVTWLIYAALLHGRLTGGWRGRRSAILTIIGFAVLLFTFFGVNFLIGGHHQGFTK